MHTAGTRMRSGLRPSSRSPSYQLMPQSASLPAICHVSTAAKSESQQRIPYARARGQVETI